jgi:hypothetical protein
VLCPPLPPLKIHFPAGIGGPTGTRITISQGEAGIAFGKYLNDLRGVPAGEGLKGHLELGDGKIVQVTVQLHHGGSSPAIDVVLDQSVDLLHKPHHGSLTHVLPCREVPAPPQPPPNNFGSFGSFGGGFGGGGFGGGIGGFGGIGGTFNGLG